MEWKQTNSKDLSVYHGIWFRHVKKGSVFFYGEILEKKNCFLVSCITV
jgi:hypothetical protein